MPSYSMITHAGSRLPSIFARLPSFQPSTYKRTIRSALAWSIGFRVLSSFALLVCLASPLPRASAMRTAELAWRQALFCAAPGRHPGQGLVAYDREIEDEEQPTMPSHDESYGSV